MTPSPPDLVQTALGKVEIAQQRMLQQYPFHARFIAAWQLHPTAAVQTMGVTVQNGTILLYFNPAFAVACSLPELMGVLHHEVNHLLFDHVFTDASRYPDRQALTVAQEVTVNEFVAEPLPGTPIVLAHFPQLPAYENTDKRYQRLANADAQDNFQSNWAPKAGPRSQKTGSPTPKTVPPAPKSVPPGMLPEHVETLDDHQLWKTAIQAGPFEQMAVRVLIREVAAGLSPAQRQTLAPSIRQRIAALGHGNRSGANRETLPSSTHGQLAWQRLLQRYVRAATEVRPVFSRPPRRFPALVGIIPGRLYRPTRARVMAVIDTSGSMSTAMLELIGGELTRLATTHTITVVECDAVVKRTYPYRGQLDQVYGRGGTNLCPPFAPTLRARIRPDVVLYFTDGYGPAPDCPPPVPVIWCLTPDGQRPAPWGRVIRLPQLPQP
jgi:predicted metal-dependent peptidase